MATSTSSLQVGGLVSGLDTNSIIDGLTQIEQNRVTREQAASDLVTAQRAAFNNLATQVYNFSSAATAISKTTTFDIFKSTSNDDELATVTGKTGGSAGSFEVVVQQLATATKASSRNFTATNTSLNLTGSIEISRSRTAIDNDPTKKTNTIEIKSTDALKDIVTKINAAEGTGVKASILNLGDGQNRLVLTAVDQGSDSFNIKELSGNAFSDSTTGLGILDTQQSIRTDFSLLKSEGMPATEDTKFSDLFTSIGGNRLTENDTITISGASANGDIATTDFVIHKATSTVKDLLDQVRTLYPDTDVSMNESGEIVLSNTGTGTGTMSISMAYKGQDATSTMSLGASKAQNVFSNLINEGTRAFYTLDGMAVSSQSNTDDDTVVGAAINLKKADATQVVKLTVSQDTDAVKAKVQSFVDAYNTVMSFIADQTKVVVSDAKSTNSKDGGVQSKGPLANNATVSRLKQQLTSLMTSPIKLLEGKTQYTSLSRLGITTDRQTGLLTVDDDKITDAIKTDFDGVKSLFTTSGYSSNPKFEMGRYDSKNTKSGVYTIDADASTFGVADNSSQTAAATRAGDILLSRTGDSKGLSITAPVGSGQGTFTFVRGLASQITSYVDNAKDTVNGIFIKSDQTYQNRISEYDKRVDKLQTQVDNYKTRLTTQFAALEQSMQRLKSQSAAFSAQLG